MIPSQAAISCLGFVNATSNATMLKPVEKLFPFCLGMSAFHCGAAFMVRNLVFFGLTGDDISDPAVTSGPDFSPEGTWWWTSFFGFSEQRQPNIDFVDKGTAPLTAVFYEVRSLFRMKPARFGIPDKEHPHVSSVRSGLQKRHKLSRISAVPVVWQGPQTGYLTPADTRRGVGNLEASVYARNRNTVKCLIQILRTFHVDRSYFLNFPLAA